MSKLLPALALAAVLLIHPPATLAAPPHIELTVPSYLYPRTSVDLTRGTRITEDGRVAGFFFVDGRLDAGFVRSLNGRFSHPIVYPGTNGTFVSGINNNGLICGAFSDPQTGGPHGFFFDGETYTQYDYPGATQTSVNAVNDAGDFCGYYDPGFTATATSFVSIGGTLTAFAIAGSNSVYPQDINNLGQVVGFYVDASSGIHGFFRDTDGTLTYPLDYPGDAVDTFYLGISDKGVITGSWEERSVGTHGFVRTATNQFISYDYPAGTRTSFSDINGKGVIAGYYFDPADSVEHSFIAKLTK